MATTTIEAQIKERIAELVQELDLVVRRGTLESLREALEGRPRAGRRRGRRRGQASAASADNLAPKIVAHVRSNPGQTVSQVAKAIGARPAVLKKTIKVMLGEKAIRKTGQKRGTRYFPAGAGRLPRTAVKRARKVRGRRRARKAKAA